MAKKHRVKRQNYVDHLRKIEKDREEYLAKRLRPKRTRDERNEEETFAATRDVMETTDRKKRRVDESEGKPEPTPVEAKKSDSVVKQQQQQDEESAAAATATKGKKTKRRY